MTIDARNTWQTQPTTISVCNTWQTRLSTSSLNAHYCAGSKISDLHEHTTFASTILDKVNSLCLCLCYPVVRRCVPVSLHTPGVDWRWDAEISSREWRPWHVLPSTRLHMYADDLRDNVNSLVKGPTERNCKQVGEGGGGEEREEEKERKKAQNDETSEKRGRGKRNTSM